MGNAPNACHHLDLTWPLDHAHHVLVTRSVMDQVFALHAQVVLVGLLVLIAIHQLDSAHNAMVDMVSTHLIQHALTVQTTFGVWE